MGEGASDIADAAICAASGNGADANCIDIKLLEGNGARLLLERQKPENYPLSILPPAELPVLCVNGECSLLNTPEVDRYFHFYPIWPGSKGSSRRLSIFSPQLLIGQSTQERFLPAVRNSALPVCLPENTLPEIADSSVECAVSDNEPEPQHELNTEEQVAVTDLPVIPDVSSLIGEHLEHILSKREGGSSAATRSAVEEESLGSSEEDQQSPERHLQEGDEDRYVFKPLEDPLRPPFSSRQECTSDTWESDPLCIQETAEQREQSFIESQSRPVVAEDDEDGQLHSTETALFVDDSPPSEHSESQVEVSIYRALAEEGRWTELLQLCERRFHDAKEEDYEARLWWLKAQLTQRLVPVSMLSAPVDTITHEVLEEEKPAKAGLSDAKIEELRGLAIELLVEVSDEFTEILKFKSALPYLQRAERANAALAPQLLELTMKALKRMQEIPEYERSDDQVEFIREAQEIVEELEGRLSGEVEVRIDEVSSVDELNQPAAFVDGAEVLAAQKALSTERRSGRFSSALWILLITALVGLGGYHLWQQSVGEAEQELFAAVEISLAEPKTPQLKPASLKRIASLGHLDALLYDIDNSDKQQGNGPSLSVVPPVVAPAVITSGLTSKTTPDALTPVKSTAPSQQTFKTTRALVNTSTPVEPESVRRLLLAPPETPTRKAIGPGYVKGFPGESKAASRGDGTPSYPVYRYSPPRTYSIVVNTKVLSRPSYTSAVRAELKKGSKVEVEEDLTLWLKIRSRGGRVGYILAQDANPVD
jgi:hypothetical protein